MIIEGIKLIHHNAQGINQPDDHAYPWQLDVFLRPPEFMTMAFLGIVGGSERIIVRGMSKELLEEFLDLNNLRDHPRLICFEIWKQEI